MTEIPLKPQNAWVFLKTQRVYKDGKKHVYFLLCESLRVGRKRVLQRQVPQKQMERGLKGGFNPQTGL